MDWWRTSVLLCQQANMHRGRDKPPVDVYTFHPFAKKPQSKPRQATQRDLDMLFGGPPQ